MADVDEQQQQQQAELIEDATDAMEQSASDEAQGAGGDATEAANGQDENGAEQKPKDQDDEDDDDDSDNDEDERKLFVGGLSWETQESALKDYLSQFGEVESCTVKIDQSTGRSRGFGFVVFKDVQGFQKSLDARPHHVDGRDIDSKKAEPQQKREAKMFVGGIKPETDDDKIREYFAQFGKILKIDRPKDPATKAPRAFCFITFKKNATVVKITKQRYHQLDEKDVECKYAQPPFNERGGGGGGGRGRGRGRGGFGNQSFGGGFGYGPGPYGGGFGGFQGGFGGPWGGGPGFGPYGGGAFGGGFGGGAYGGGYNYGQSGFGKTGRGGRHQGNFRPY